MNRRDFNRLLLSLPGVAILPGIIRAAAAPTPSATSLAAVDTHAHIFQRGLKVAATRRYTPDYDAPLRDYLQQLDAHGSSHGVLVQPSFLGTDNSYLVAALHEQPQRLRGVVVIEPTASEATLAEFAAVGVVGIRLNLIGAELPDLRQAPWPGLLRQLVKLDWLVEVQRDARDLPQIVAPLIAAGVKIVVDHFGRPDPKLGVADPGFRYLLSVGPSRRVWLKLSGAYRNGAEGVGDAIARAAIPLLRDAFGAERLLWGSDWPHTQFERTVSYSAVRAQFDQWITDPAERATILQKTPAELFRFHRAAMKRA
jgi:predicted TIM-barrel fold metal-dependent hydrolase